MEILIGFFVFCLVLFIYLHIQFHLKTGEDLEMYEVDEPSKEKLEEICDIRQPVLFDFDNKNIMETTKNLSQDQRDAILKKFNVTQKDIFGAIGGEEDKGISKIISRPTPKTRREEILEEAALYREALGYDDAKSQAIFNALGEAAPAFFKGKNVREAIPQVLESINKSKAFEGPKDIKQAAGQLAIQRRMLADKAKAEELARLAIYGMKNRETITDLVKGIPGSFVAGVLPKGIESNPTLQASLRPGGIYSTTEGDFFYAVPSAKGDKVSGLQKLG